MRCKKGDLAIIIKSMRPANLYKVVEVVELIGLKQQHEIFEWRGIVCAAPVTDHIWGIRSAGTPFETGSGSSPIAYGPDTWLRPLKGDGTDDDTLSSEPIDFSGVEVLTQS